MSQEEDISRGKGVIYPQWEPDWFIPAKVTKASYELI